MYAHVNVQKRYIYTVLISVYVIKIIKMAMNNNESACIHICMRMYTCKRDTYIQFVISTRLLGCTHVSSSASMFVCICTHVLLVYMYVCACMRAQEIHIYGS